MYVYKRTDGEYVLRQQVDLDSNQVVSERPEMTTWKTSMTTGRWNCQVIQANMKKKRTKWLIHYVQGSLNKFPDFFCMGTFIDSKQMKL